MTVTVTPRSQPRILPVSGTAIAIILVLLLVNHLMGAEGRAKPQLAASTTTVGVVLNK
jgi:hypothetical protein